MASQIITQKLGELEGLPELFGKLNKLILKGTVPAGIKDALIHAALPVRDEARSMVPTRTGRLREAIYASMGSLDKPSVLIGVTYRSEKSKARKGAPHAHLIEYGTSRMRPQPYMRPAIVAARASAARILQERLTKLILEIS